MALVQTKKSSTHPRHRWSQSDEVGRNSRPSPHWTRRTLRIDSRPRNPPGRSATYKLCSQWLLECADLHCLETSAWIKTWMHAFCMHAWCMHYALYMHRREPWKKWITYLLPSSEMRCSYVKWRMWECERDFQCIMKLKLTSTRFVVKPEGVSNVFLTFFT